MFRAGVILGTLANLILILSLLLVSGWMIDSWSDTRVAYTGLVVTLGWLTAFVIVAGSPLLAYALHRRKAPPGRVMSILWLPPMALVSLCIVGLIISPP